MSAVPCKFGDPFELGYCCNISKQIIKDGPITLSGTHRRGMSNESVTRLEIFDCDMPKFPLNLQDLFPKLQFLIVTKCTLESIGREHIGKWKNLRVFYIQECRLKCLKGDIFRGLMELKEISLPKNLLEEIAPDILDGLKMLTYVDLTQNPSIEMFANRSDLNAIKREIKLKCKPKPARLEVDELMIVEDGFQENHEKTPPECQLAKDAMKFRKVKNLLTDKAFKDCKITAGESSFNMHKLILAAHSQTLAELFRSNPKAKGLTLYGFPTATFKAVFDFIYTDQLPADVNYQEVFAAATLLKMADLREAVAAHLMATIDGSNAFHLLVLGNTFGHEGLRMKSFKCICSEFFSDRQLNEELAKEPEKLRELIDAKKKLDLMLEEMSKKD